MPDDIEYDVFLSYASDDGEWCEQLAERLRDEGVRVWFDKWRILPGDNIPARLNAGLKNSRKMIAVFTENYFRDDKVWTRAESFARQYKDVLAEDRPLIPVLLRDCEPEPLLAVIRREPGERKLGQKCEVVGSENGARGSGSGRAYELGDVGSVCTGWREPGERKL